MEKVDCEDCGEKKDARMRTCLENLPNLLIVHLKRFELDYRTFETVKLNDRCSFPMLLDLKPYTRKGTDERRVLKIYRKNELLRTSTCVSPRYFFFILLDVG